MEKAVREGGVREYTAHAPGASKLAAIAGVVVGAATGFATRSIGLGVVAAIVAAWLGWVFAPRVVLRVDPTARRVVRSRRGRVLLDVPFEAIRNVSARQTEHGQQQYGESMGRRYKVTSAVVEIGTSDDDITLGDVETEKDAIAEAKELARAFELDEALAEAPLLWLAVRKSRSP